MVLSRSNAVQCYNDSILHQFYEDIKLFFIFFQKTKKPGNHLVRFPGSGVHFINHFHQLSILSSNISKIFSFMRKHTACTVFYSFFCDTKIPAAFLSQCIQGAITEEAIKIVFISTFMSGKKFTFSVAEIRIFLIFPILLLHDTSFIFP